MNATTAFGSRAAMSSPARMEFVISAIVTGTAVMKVLMFGSALSVAGDLIFLAGLVFLRSKAALVMLLLCSAIAIPSVPGIDKIMGGPFHIELLAIVLAVRVWVSSGFSSRPYWPKAMVVITAIYATLLGVSILRGVRLADHLVTARYFLLMLITTYAVRGWIIQKSISRNSIEELFFRALRAGLVVYLIIFILQFINPAVYNSIFVSSDGEREGSRVAYQVQNYIPLISLALLFAGTVRSSLNGLPSFYAEMSNRKWILLAFFGMLATGARMVLLQWLILAAVFIFFRSARAVIGLVFALAIASVMLSLPLFAGVVERFSSISDIDSFVGNLGIRLLPALSAMNEMSGFDYIIGKGFDYKFFVPWFDTRSDDFDAYSTFIDQLWATVYVQGGLAGCLLVLAPFIIGIGFYFRFRKPLASTPVLRFLILSLLLGIHGFANLAYAKDVYVIIGILAGAVITFRASENAGLRS